VVKCDNVQRNSDKNITKLHMKSLRSPGNLPPTRRERRTRIRPFKKNADLKTTKTERKGKTWGEKTKCFRKKKENSPTECPKKPNYTKKQLAPKGFRHRDGKPL